jgi:hypothetical protein
VDCFVAIAPRNDEQKHSRGAIASGFCSIAPFEGAGNAGRSAAPAASRANFKKHTSIATTGQPKSSGIPCATVLRRIACSPRGTGLVSPRPPEFVTWGLDTSVGVPGPHAFAVRPGRVRLAHPKRPSHPASYVRDDREAPL